MDETPDRPVIQEPELQPGVRVHHARLGSGRIVARDGPYVTIEFDDGDTRVITSAYPLTRGADAGPGPLISQSTSDPSEPSQVQPMATLWDTATPLQPVVAAATRAAYDLPTLKRRLKEIKEAGYVYNARPGNDGGVGNTLEDLLGVPENNLKIADYGEYELKAKRRESASLLTLFHVDPSPREPRSIVNVMIEALGWPYDRKRVRAVREGVLADERSFRATLGPVYSERGLRVRVDRAAGEVFIEFDRTRVADKHAEWLRLAEMALGAAVETLRPYWVIGDLAQKAQEKLDHTVFVIADTRDGARGREFRYSEAYLLAELDLTRFVAGIEQGHILIDFDARSSHNHGTKFRVRSALLPTLFRTSERLL